MILFGAPFLEIDARPQCSDSPASDPCAFPAENFEGGIVLGTPQLSGTELGLFRATSAQNQGFNIDSEYPRDTETYDRMPTGATVDQTGIATVGFNVDSVEELFLYKTWKTTGDRDVPTQTEVDNGNYKDVYTYIQADQANLDGPSGDVNGVNCRDPDSDDNFNPNHCDLVATVSEVGFVNVDFFADVNVDVIGDDQITDKSWDQDDLDPRPTNGFWVDDPEDDVCSALDIIDILGSIDFNLQIQGICLGTLDVTFERGGGDIAFGLGLNEINIREAELYDLQVRSHSYFAVPPRGTGLDRTNPALTKTLELGDPNSNDDFYAEIRWGKGHDRARFPISRRDSYSTLQANRDAGSPGSLKEEAPDQTRYAGPAPDNAYLEEGPTASGLSYQFACKGNPFPVNGDSDCDRDAQNRGSPQPGPYDDVSGPGPGE
jgi:hypothetical protein